MYSDAIMERSVRGNSVVYGGVIFLLLAGAVVMRAALPYSFIDLFIDYTAETGSIVEKIHPGSYAIAGVFALSIVTLRAGLDAWAYRAFKGLVGFAGAIGLLIAYLIVAGRVGSAGYLIDTYLAAILAGLNLLLLPPAMRIRIADLVLLVLIASAAMGVFETATHTRIMPYPIPEIEFRATGLAGHPLTLGLLSACAILFVSNAGWSRMASLSAIVILFLGVAAASARISMLAASLAVIIAILAGPMRAGSDDQRARLKALLLVGGAIVLAGGLTLLAFSGHLDRFQRGFADASAMARVDVYKLFLYADWSEIVFGTDVVRIARLAETRLNLAAIESSFVVLIFQFGIFGTILFAGGVFACTRKLIAGAPAATVAATLIFFAVALSNNTLTSKTPTVLILFVLLIGVQARTCPRDMRFG